MRIVVHQGLNQKAVLDVDALISGHRNFKFLITKHITPVFKFVAPDIAFVKH